MVRVMFRPSLPLRARAASIPAATRLALGAALLTLLDTAQGLQTREATVRQRRNDVTRALSDRMGGIPARAESPALVELRRLANQLVLRELNAEKAQLDETPEAGSATVST